MQVGFGDLVNSFSRNTVIRVGPRSPEPGKLNLLVILALRQLYHLLYYARYKVGTISP